MKQDVAILLTACVNPMGMSYTVLQDSHVRKQQYIEALRYYLDNTGVIIVFVDNTESDLTPYFEKEIETGRLEILSFDGNHFEKAKGKGYGESLIIEYGLNNSRFLIDINLIIKITGRLKCLNIEKVIAKCCNSETVYSWFVLDEYSCPICESRVFIAPRVFYEQYFLPKKNEIDDSNHQYFEHVLLKSLNKWIGNKRNFKEIWFPLVLNGIGGSTGQVYSKSFFQSIQFYIHYFLHKFNYYGPVKFWIKKKRRVEE